MGKRGVSVCPHPFIRPREAIQIFEGYGMGMGRDGELNSRSHVPTKMAI